MYIKIANSILIGYFISLQIFINLITIIIVIYNLAIEL